MNASTAKHAKWECCGTSPIGRPRSTMDSIRVSEAPDTGSIPVEATILNFCDRFFAFDKMSVEATIK